MLRLARFPAAVSAAFVKAGSYLGSYLIRTFSVFAPLPVASAVPCFPPLWTGTTAGTKAISLRPLAGLAGQIRTAEQKKTLPRPGILWGWDKGTGVCSGNNIFSHCPEPGACATELVIKPNRVPARPVQGKDVMAVLGLVLGARAGSSISQTRH